MTEDMLNDINLLLENSTIDAGSHFKIDDNFVPINMRNDIYPNQDGHVIDLIHDQSLTISKIFYQQNKGKQSVIKQYLLEKLPEGGQVCATVVNVFYQIGALSDLIEYIKSNTKVADNYTFHTLKQINFMLFLFWSSINKTDVISLRDWVKESLDGINAYGKQLAVVSGNTATHKKLLNGILQQTNRILVQDIKYRVDAGFNPEINIDEKELKEEFTKFGFPTDLSEALDKIDQKFNASHDAFDFKGCMDLLRSFTERLYRTILDQYGEKGKAIHEQDSEAVAKFFKKNGLIGENFADMLVNQRHFLSNLASHRLKSREDDARLSKNMVIEMSLYLLKRFKSH
jgi:hypothetical protein